MAYFGASSSSPASGKAIAHALKLSKAEYENAHINSYDYPAKAYGCFSPFSQSDIDYMINYCKTTITNIFNANSKIALFIYNENNENYYVSAIDNSSGLYLSVGQYTSENQLTNYNNNESMYLHGSWHGADLTVNKSSKLITNHSSTYGSDYRAITLPTRLFIGLANKGYFFHVDTEFKLANDASFITGYQYDYETEITNVHSNDTLYYVTDDSRNDINLYMAQGDNRIPSKYFEDISDYEFWYEDVSISDYPVQTDISFEGDNANRDFEFVFNLGPRAVGSECVLIGCNDSAREIYYDSYGNVDLKAYGGILGQASSIVPNFAGKDVVIKRESGVVTVTSNGTVTVTSDTWDLPGYLKLFAYTGNNYKYVGHINYFGFRWLN